MTTDTPTMARQITIVASRAWEPLVTNGTQSAATKAMIAVTGVMIRRAVARAIERAKGS